MPYYPGFLVTSRSILPPRGEAYPPDVLVLGTAASNFREPRTREVPGIHLLGTWVDRGEHRRWRRSLTTAVARRIPTSDNRMPVTPSPRMAPGGGGPTRTARSSG